MLESLKVANPDITIHSVLEADFQAYGQVIDRLPHAQLQAALAKKPIPDQGNVYVASDQDLEVLPEVQRISAEVFGGLAVEAGYCNGHSYQLNCQEWHQSPEVNLATEDIVLFLGQAQKLQGDQYDVADIEAFYVPAGTLIMLYGTTMHFAPCRTVDRGFKCLVILLAGINSDLPTTIGEHDPKLFKLGKWLIAHPDNKKFVDQGAVVGLKGPNLAIKLE